MSGNFLKDIEENYNIEKVKLGDLPIWPILRIPYHETYRAERLNIKSRRQRLSLKMIIKILPYFFYGLKNIFQLKGFHYFFFSSSERRKFINGKYHERVIEKALEILPKTLLVENPFPTARHYKRSAIPTKNIISEVIFFSGTLIFSFFFAHKLKIGNEGILYKIYKDHDIWMDHKKILKRFIGQYYFMKFILHFIHLKATFFVFPGSSMGYIRALKDKKIPVIEFQHGVINNRHINYIVSKDLGKTLYPDYLLTYGDREKDIFNPSNYFISKENVIPIGYSFLEMKLKEKKFSELRDKYLLLKKKIIAFSFQEPFAEETFIFLNKASKLSTDMIFVVIPRNPNTPFEFKFDKNIFIEEEYNIYDLLHICDIHSTINSTCAIESILYGVPNVLLNINNRASDYYKLLLDEKLATYYVKTPEEFIAKAKDLTTHGVDRSNLINKGQTLIKTNFTENFTKFAVEFDTASEDPK